jgi:hypothetical protein
MKYIMTVMMRGVSCVVHDGFHEEAKKRRTVPDTSRTCGNAKSKGVQTIPKHQQSFND